MIIGVGVDVVDIPRFTATLERVPRLASRLFTTQERGLAPQSLAGRFAAKEALAKALGAPGTLSWQDAEIVRGDHGAPHLRVTGTVAQRAADLGIADFHLSISHDGAVAVAFVVAQGQITIRQD